MLRTLVSFILLFQTCYIFANPVGRKQMLAVRTPFPMEIDGVLNEAAWQQSSVAEYFIQREPFNGKPASFNTRVYVLYDDLGLYIGAHIFDPHPDSISMELRSRDNLGMADYFGVTIDTYNDGLNAFGFFVTARGVQADMKINRMEHDDTSWDAVWKSATSIGSEGWFAELFIPYSALRFAKGSSQQWGVNFFRSIQRNRESTSWNFIDAKVNNTLAQSGVLTIPGMLEPPLRLSATPYLSAGTLLQPRASKWSHSYNAGMDVKWGISESFTLDLTLIPDFGQVESDDRIFSLSPFEVYYEEKRPFFTEGTEFFQKGNVFYTRRVGATPKKYNAINRQYAADQIISNPESVQLINAAKLSGKTGGGLGIGVFNALTAEASAIVLDSAGNQQKIVSEPLTNYNMMVFEQALPNNSQISVYNTNVLRIGNHPMANVTGTEFALRNKSNSYQLYGMLNITQQYHSDKQSQTGERLLFNLGKISGKFRADAWFNLMTDTYDPNDMGFQRSNNEIGNGYNIRYNSFEPKGHLLKWYSRLNFYHTYLYSNKAFTSLEINGDGRATFRNHLTIGGNVSVSPLGKNDYFEPRVKGRHLHRPPAFNLMLWGSPDYRKKIMADYRFGFGHIPGWDYINWTARITPRWRVQENFLIIPMIHIDYQYNSYGYVRDSVNVNQYRDIIFGKRDVQNITSSVTADYIFSPNTSLAFRLRHYWLNVDYHDYYDLERDGGLRSNDYNGREDFAVNTFNIDMVFRWNFAPGSEILLVWKNAIYKQQYDEKLSVNYFRNLESVFESPAANSLNIKLLYYLDWQHIRALKKPALIETNRLIG